MALRPLPEIVHGERRTLLADDLCGDLGQFVGGHFGRVVVAEDEVVAWQPGESGDRLGPATAERLVILEIRHAFSPRCQPALQCRPPSTHSSTPVMYWASSEARNTEAMAMSQPVPCRFIGGMALRAAVISSTLP